MYTHASNLRPAAARRHTPPTGCFSSRMASSTSSMPPFIFHPLGNRTCASFQRFSLSAFQLSPERQPLSLTFPFGKLHYFTSPGAIFGLLDITEICSASRSGSASSQLIAKKTALQISPGAVQFVSTFPRTLKPREPSRPLRFLRETISPCVPVFRGLLCLRPLLPGKHRPQPSLNLFKPC